jgi:hypothetical protein
VRRLGGVAVQGLRRRLRRPDPALRGADATSGSLLRGRLPRLALQTVRHRRQPGAGSVRGRRRGAAATCCTRSTASARRWATTRTSRRCARARTRPTA